MRCKPHACAVSSVTWLQGATAAACADSRLLCRYRVPALLAVGLEGLWGLVISAVALPILTVARGSDGLPLDSATQAFRVGMSTPCAGISVAWLQFDLCIHGLPKKMSAIHAFRTKTDEL